MLKVLKLNKNKSLKTLKFFLEKKEVYSKNQTFIVKKIIKNVKKNGDKAVLKYEKIFKIKDKLK